MVQKTHNMLEMRHITKEFTGVRALDDVNLTVRKGEVHAICGENGAGKSTLMKVLSGVWPAGTYEGEIQFEGEPVRFRNIKDSEAAGIVIIHQELALSPYLSVAENIFLGSEIRKFGVIDWDATNARAEMLLAEVGLDISPQTLVMDLGVGKQQLVEIAKALSKDVKLLILDEPTAALNDDDSAHLLDLMRKLQGREVTQVIISHKLNEISAIGDRVTILRDGQTIGTSPLKGEGGITEQEIIRQMVGRELSNLYPDHESAAGEMLFEISNWNVSHPIDTNRQVVKNVSLNVRAGEIVGIAGLMGAGRTELAMSVFGKSYGVNISGTVRMHGQKVDTSTVPRAIAAGLAYVPEDRKGIGLNLIQDVRRNVTAAGLPKLASGGVIDDTEESDVVEQYTRDLRIKTSSDATLVNTLSGGNQQKVVLAKWMYTEPELLILDEPTRGIDVGAKYEIYQIINSLADEGKGVLVISSELPELLGICDRIYTLNEGRLTGCFSGAEANQELLMEYMAGDKTEEGKVA
ncbi:ABC transporter ATP-binding protein [Actinobaculum suis]|uniref:multiple monosaccharide ABC transporter ATP-binding protein n=1 Tax=Actinobaculum suis TaxID=1657 RepID=UPI00066FB800|nr:multiple monosaccharide ABC transporter ATP-binding protein [Actinobaculum suis]KMY23907.1 ABC transporter ATP-binding protein [Actinobaculum suis]OCA93342.1 ABC transporter ATP-binding protein [Actinobaculum suis]